MRRMCRSSRARRFGLTSQHPDVVTQKPEWTRTREWGEAALRACRDHLGVSHMTEAHTVQVLDAWTEDGVAFCVIYQYPYFDGVLGIRRTFDENMYGDDATDPDEFGRDVADFDIGEPLGTVVERLRVDAAGVHWWGDLDDELPQKPAG
jgi:hypothetical protein